MAGRARSQTSRKQCQWVPPTKSESEMRVLDEPHGVSRSSDSSLPSNIRNSPRCAQHRPCSNTPRQNSAPSAFRNSGRLTPLQAGDCVGEKVGVSQARFRSSADACTSRRSREKAISTFRPVGSGTTSQRSHASPFVRAPSASNLSRRRPALRLIFVREKQEKNKYQTTENKEKATNPIT